MAVVNLQDLSSWGKPGNTWQRTNEVSADRMGGVPGGRTAVFTISGLLNCKIAMELLVPVFQMPSKKPNQDLASF